MPGRVRVLLVDDRPENLLSLEAILDAPDYELVKVSSGGEALRYLLSHDCAIILLDVQMPELDGFETADLIKKDPRHKDTPIIFVTALSNDAHHIARGYATGAVDYISKPIVPAFLRAKVSAFAALHRSREKILEQQRQLRDLERKEHEHRLAELELASLRREKILDHRYRVLVDGLDDAIVWTAEPTSLVLSFVSAAGALVCGAPLDLTRPDAIKQLVHADDLADFRLRARGLGLERAETIEHRVDRAGEVGWLRTTLRLEKKLDSAGAELHGFSVDVSEAKRVERTLRTLARVSDDLATTLDLQEMMTRLASSCARRVCDGCVVVVDALDGMPAARADGWATPEVAAAATPLLQHPDRAPTLLGEQLTPVHVRDVAKELTGSDAFLRAVKDAGVHSFLSLPLRVAGEVVGSFAMWSHNKLRPMDDEAMLLAAEISRRASQSIEHAVLFRRIKDAVAHRDEFLSVASHELRTPLAPLQIAIHAALKKLDVLPENDPLAGVVKHLRIADRQVDRLQVLIDMLLDVSRIRAGKLVLERESVDLAVLVDEVVSRFRPELTRKNIEVVLELVPVEGNWDRSRLDQVVTNLLTNAIKYGDGKPVRIGVGPMQRGGEAPPSHGGARIEVIDKGLGIDPEDAKRIFDRFERVETTRSIGGLGLGLYITRQIVHAHGGDIRVESAPGQGSRFTVDLPNDFAG